MENEPAVRERSAFIDNARAALIVLVVLGHAIGNFGLGGEPPGEDVYRLLYAFHIPAFAFVSGLLAKPDVFSRKGLVRLGRLLAVYVAFQIPFFLVFGVRYPDRAGSLEAFLLYPTYALWWLVSLMSWHLMLPLFARGRSVWAALGSVLAALALSLASGFVLADGLMLSLSRTFVFFPFFLTGFRATQQGWRVSSALWARAIALVVFVAAYLRLSEVDTFPLEKWLYATRGYGDLAVTGWEGPAFRLAITGIAAVLTLALLTLMPRRRLWLSDLGGRTLSVYLWHALIIYSASTFGLLKSARGSWPAALVTTAVLVLALGWGPLAEFTAAWLGGRRSAAKG